MNLFPEWYVFTFRQQQLARVKDVHVQQNMKPVQFCTGLIFCTFSAILAALQHYHFYFEHYISDNI